MVTFFGLNDLRNGFLELKNLGKVGLHETIEPLEQNMEFTDILPDSHNTHFRYDVTRQ